MVADLSQKVNRFIYFYAYLLRKIDIMVNKITQYSIFNTLHLQNAYYQVTICDEEQFTVFEACDK